MGHLARMQTLPFDPQKLTLSISSEHKTTYKSPGSNSLPYSLPSLWKICKWILQLSPFDHATWQRERDIGARGSQDLRSPSPIMAPADNLYNYTTNFAAVIRVIIQSANFLLGGKGISVSWTTLYTLLRTQVKLGLNCFVKFDDHREVV